MLAIGSWEAELRWQCFSGAHLQYRNITVKPYCVAQSVVGWEGRTSVFQYGDF